MLGLYPATDEKARSDFAAWPKAQALVLLSGRLAESSPFLWSGDIIGRLGFGACP